MTTLSRTPLLWECSAGHKWRATLGKIRDDQWCAVCRKEETAAKLRLTLEEIQRRAREKGGRCLASSYGGTANTPLQFECANGHQWKTAPNTIRKSWCPYCAGKIVTLDDVRSLARERGGECLSTTYVNDHTKLVWRCRYNHTWRAIPGAIKRGSWCPECSAGLGERLCRTFFESLFGVTFPQAYPDWLKLGHRTKLQLDGYNERLALAFEHHGQYHFRVDGHYSRNREQLKKRQELDRKKAELCAEYGITLVVIPEIPAMLALDHAQRFIIAACNKKGVSVPYQDATPDLAGAYSPDWWNYYNQLAKASGGCLVSPQYFGSGKRHRWKCKYGHEWDTVPNSIQQGTWCPYCIGSRISVDEKANRLSEMRRVAQLRGGECLSQNYASCNDKMLWRCSQGHEWEATPQNVHVRKSWCPHCYGNCPFAIEDLQKLAASRGGDLLSAEHANRRSVLRWRCRAGHEWQTSAANVMRGSWCPICGREK